LTAVINQDGGAGYQPAPPSPRGVVHVITDGALKQSSLVEQVGNLLHQAWKEVRMEYYKQIIQAIYDAIGDVNRSLEPERALERSPETVLLGDGKLESLQFLNFTVAIEENIERMFKKTISVTEVALLGAESEPLTVSALANRIENLLGFPAQPVTGVAS
jgi:hypothetical protein